MTATRDKVPVQRIGPYTKGEIPAPLQVTFTDENGTALDLTGYSLTFRLTRVDAAVVTPAGTAEFTSPSGGVARYTFAAGDLATAGLYRAQFWASIAGGSPRKYASDIFEFFVETVTEAP